MHGFTPTLRTRLHGEVLRLCEEGGLRAVQHPFQELLTLVMTQPPVGLSIVYVGICLIVLHLRFHPTGVL